MTSPSPRSRHGVDDAWDLGDVRPPVDDRPTTLLTYAVRHAILAPNAHNSQPWRFELRDGVLILRLDTDRAVSALDPAGREGVISCGAALMNVRLALRHLGRQPAVRLLPEPRTLATVEIGELAPPTANEEALFAAIPRRHTHRSEFASRSVPDDLLARLVGAAEAEHAELVRVPTDRRDALADLVEEGDRQRFADPDKREELAEWLRTPTTGAADGVPVSTLGQRGLAAWLAPMVVRSFDIGRTQAERDRQALLGSPALVALTSPDDGFRAWLETGQALQRLLLRATHLGLAASFLNAPIENPDLRQRLAAMLPGDGIPQLVLRLGWAVSASSATPRRPVDEVLRRS